MNWILIYYYINFNNQIWRKEGVAVRFRLKRDRDHDWDQEEGKLELESAQESDERHVPRFRGHEECSYRVEAPTRAKIHQHIRVSTLHPSNLKTKTKTVSILMESSSNSFNLLNISQQWHPREQGIDHWVDEQCACYLECFPRRVPKKTVRARWWH